MTIAPPALDTATVAKRRSRPKISISDVVAKGGTIVSLVVLVAVFSALRPDTFPTVSNLRVVLSQAAVLAIVAGGLTIVLVLGEFDLSIASVTAFAGVLGSHLMATGVNDVAAVVIAIGLAAFIGAVNGVIVAYLRVNAFIATLGTGAVVAGLALWASDEGTAQLIPARLTGMLRIGQGQLIGIPIPVILSVVVLAVLWVFLNKTEAGRYVDATGGNREAARLSGINVRRYLLSGFVISALCAGVGGVILASSLGGGYTNAADSYLLESFTACFLGAVTLRSSEFHIVGTAVGVLLLSVTFSGLSQLNVPDFWQNIAQGGILVIAVALTVVANQVQQWLVVRKQRRLLHIAQ